MKHYKEYLLYSAVLCGTMLSTTGCSTVTQLVGDTAKTVVSEIKDKKESWRRACGTFQVGGNDCDGTAFSQNSVSV